MALAHEVSDRCPPFAANLMAAMRRRAQTLLDHVEHLTLRDAEQRVGWFLLRVRLLTSPESVVTGDVEIELPFEKTVIASYLNIKPETLSRILHQLRDRGFRMQRNKIAMPEAQALCGYCDARAAEMCPYGDTKHCPHPVADTIEPI
jgi:CRP-like cAMP-binding protein